MDFLITGAQRDQEFIQKGYKTEHLREEARNSKNQNHSGASCH